VARVPPENEELLRCSFCGKTQKEARTLIAGPTVFICDECVTVCVDIIRKDVTLPFDPAETERWRSRAVELGGKAVCTLCGAAGLAEDMLVVDGRGRLCGVCADAVDDALAAGV
jgi:hypothetical protein